MPKYEVLAEMETFVCISAHTQTHTRSLSLTHKHTQTHTLSLSLSHSLSLSNQTPKYEVLAEMQTFEVREYKEFTVCSTPMGTGFSAFESLAG